MSPVIATPDIPLSGVHVPCIRSLACYNREQRAATGDITHFGATWYFLFRKDIMLPRLRSGHARLWTFVAW